MGNFKIGVKNTKISNPTTFASKLSRRKSISHYLLEPKSMKWIRTQIKLQNSSFRFFSSALARARTEIRAWLSNERRLLACGSPPSYILKCLMHTHTPFMDNDSILFSNNSRQISSIRSYKRSIMTWSSVDKQQIIEALEKFLSDFEDLTLSTMDKSNIFIDKLIRSGNLDGAIYAFSYLHNRQIHVGLNTYNILLNAVSEANNFDLFTEIFKRLLLSELYPDFTSYVSVAKAFQNVSGPNMLLKFIRDISEITISQDPIVMNRIIFITAKSGQLDKSLLIYEELKNSNANLDTVTFNTILVMLGRAGKVEQMLNEFNIMKDLGHAPNIITYNTLINCLRRLGRLEMFNLFAKEMVKRGIMLDLRTYTALIDGLGRAGHIDDAITLFDEMKKSHRLSIYNYRAMINNLKKAGNFELAMKFLEEMNSGTSKLIGPEDFKLNKKRKYS